MTPTWRPGLNIPINWVTGLKLGPPAWAMIPALWHWLLLMNRTRRLNSLSQRRNRVEKDYGSCNCRHDLVKLAKESQTGIKPKGRFRKRCPKCGIQLRTSYYGYFVPPKRNSHLYKVIWCLSDDCDYVFVVDQIISWGFFLIR